MQKELFNREKSKSEFRTFDVPQRRGETVKPSQLIRMTGHHPLGLYARRALTLLWRNAFQAGVEPGKQYRIHVRDLIPHTHRGYEGLEEAIEQLMTTLVYVEDKDGVRKRTQYLGGTKLDGPKKKGGMLVYSLDPVLIELLRDSTVWGRVPTPVLYAFGTKYTISLYENCCQLLNLAYKERQSYSLNDWRAMLGVGPERYQKFGELNKHVMKPAIEEINAIAHFAISVKPIKSGKRVAAIELSWRHKSEDEIAAAEKEISRGKTGRRARLRGTVENIVFDTDAAVSDNSASSPQS